MAIGNDNGGHKVSIAVGFDREMFTELNALARRDDRPFSSMVRLLIREAMAARSHKEKA